MEEQDKIMNGAMTFHKTKFSISEGSFLGIVNCLYKKKERERERENEIPVFQIKLLHININPQCPGKKHAFIFCLILYRAQILIYFSRDSTGNRKDCGIKICLYFCGSSTVVLFLGKLANHIKKVGSIIT